MQKAINLTRGTVLCTNLEEASGSLARGRGLMGRDALAPGAGLLIGAGPLISLMWIHTFFMRFALDLIFLNRAGRIVRIMANVKPWRITAPVFGACCVLELEAGAAEQTSSRTGDEIRIE